MTSRGRDGASTAAKEPTGSLEGPGRYPYSYRAASSGTTLCYRRCWCACHPPRRFPQYLTRRFAFGEARRMIKTGLHRFYLSCKIAYVEVAYG